MPEDKYLALSLGFAKWLACQLDTIQLAVLASFFSSLAANISIIIQSRTFCEIQCAQAAEPAQTGEREPILTARQRALLARAASEVTAALPIIRR